jgi:hypothetical protein
MHPSSGAHPHPQLLALSGSSQPPLLLLLLLLHCMPPAVVTAAADVDAEVDADAVALGVCCMT